MTIRPRRSFWRSSSSRIPYAWLVAFFLVPFLIVLKISLSQTAIAQPPYTPVLRSRGRLARHRAVLCRPVARQLRLPRLRSALFAVLCEEPGDRRVLDAAAARHRLSDRLRHRRARRGGCRPMLVVLVILPFWTSFLIRIYAWMNILQHDGPLNQLLLGAAYRARAAGLARPPIPPSISASSIPICRSWCCRSMRRWRNSTSRCSRPPPISAARAGRRSGW